MNGSVTVLPSVSLELSDGVEVTKEASGTALVVASGGDVVADSCGVIDDTVCSRISGAEVVPRIIIVVAEGVLDSLSIGAVAAVP